jgi:hypothetical protein
MPRRASREKATQPKGSDGGGQSRKEPQGSEMGKGSVTSALGPNLVSEYYVVIVW